MKDKSRGLLPFRVQQFYEGMVKDLKKTHPDFARFVCAAGIVSHYVGDACQPLHVSSWFNGDTSQMIDNPKKGKPNQPDKIPLGSGVHGAYEDDMVNFHIGDITPVVQADNDAAASQLQGRQARGDGVHTAHSRDVRADQTQGHRRQVHRASTAGNDRKSGGGRALGKFRHGDRGGHRGRGSNPGQRLAERVGGSQRRDRKRRRRRAHSTSRCWRRCSWSRETFYPSKTIDHICEIISC